MLVFGVLVSFADMDLMKEIFFYVNDEKHTVILDSIEINTVLNTYLRTNLNLTGTKKMCAEGGCGVCIVAVQKMNQTTGKVETVAVNSCLVPIFSCLGWNIYTIEGIGSQDEPHSIQKVLYKFNGTQCGFCSPGMIMNMFALGESKDLKMQDVENSFGGNICRCTGYRPIMSAFKSLCTDVTSECLGAVPEIEELKLCKKMPNKNCDNYCKKNPLLFKLQYKSWIKVFVISDLLQVIKTLQSGEKKSSYMLVAGNTGQGVYKSKRCFDVYIDINNVKELTSIEVKKDEIILGANITLTQAMTIFNEVSESNQKFAYLKKLAEHIDLIANVPVRNTGTLAGNLLLKHQNKDFPSDIFLILETIEARVCVVDVNNKETYVTPENFLNMDMSEKVLKNIKIPCYDKSYKYMSYKIMPRSQNAHALVNAGFLLKFNANKYIVNARIVFGNISATFIHATNSEKFLVGKNIFNNDILQETFELLDEEIIPEYKEGEPATDFRKKLSISLFYKFILNLANDVVSEEQRSGGHLLQRPVSKGTQDFETNESLYPLTKAITKLEAIVQTTGEAKYIADMPDLPNQLFASFVLANAPAHSIIESINIDKAMLLEGVVSFIDKNDIPGRNTFTPKSYHSFTINVEEELFCSGVVKYYHQPVGVIVANSQELAEKASELIEIKYKMSPNKPLVKIRDILTANAKHKIFQDQIIHQISKGNDEKHIIKGTVDLNWQYHFHMENHCCNVVPTEDGLNMYPSSQWMDLSQNAAAVALNIPANKINVKVRRLGGGFGGKIMRNAQISTAAALAAYKLNKPVKLWLPLEKNFQIIGKRHPASCDYEAAVDDDGVIQYLNNLIYYDHGAGNNSQILMLFLEVYFGCYNTSSWFTNTFLTHTDMHPSCYVRSPGSLEGQATAEAIMEHIAMTIGMDPLDFRLANLKQDNDEILKYIVDFIDWADIESRKKNVKRFNEENKWVKKGLSVIPMVYPFAMFFTYNVIVSIYHMDGTVAISHGGVEIGQGINTKAAQVCAYKLGIPVENISVKPSNNLTGANASMTGASITSEGVCWSIIKACDILLKRMEPFKKDMTNPTWQEIVKKCYDNFIDLSATAMASPVDLEQGKYNVYGVCAAEIELDALTGQYNIIRVDLLEDVGDSINPKIDIGQVEGAFIMGLGYFLTEQISVSQNGEILSNRTWNYKPPGAKDIPIDFRVKFPKNNPNGVGVLKSKATGEPAVCLAVAIPLAIRQAVSEIRQYFDPCSSKWFRFDGPTTVEQIFSNCLHDYKSYSL